MSHVENLPYVNYNKDLEWAPNSKFIFIKVLKYLTEKYNARQSSIIGISLFPKTWLTVATNYHF